MATVDYSLEADIGQRMKGCIRNALGNYWFAYSLLAVAVATSATSAILVAAGEYSNILKAILAAIPGITAVILATFKFQARAEWWWAKYHRLDALYRQLKVEGIAEREVSAKLSAEVKDINKSWPGFGDAPAGK